MSMPSPYAVLKEINQDFWGWICIEGTELDYDTGAIAVYGDGLLTLSTCSYHTKNGRFVVVARKEESPQLG